MCHVKRVIPERFTRYVGRIHGKMGNGKMGNGNLGNHLGKMGTENRATGKNGNGKLGNLTP